MPRQFYLRKLLDQLRQPLTSRARRQARPRPLSRLQLELLEDRITPALSLVTAANPSGALALTTSPLTLNDSAVLSNGANENGTITFKLFAPGVNTSTGTASYTDLVTVTGNGTYSTTTMGNNPGGFTLPGAGNVTGNYTWTANYGGDTNGNGTANDPGTSAAEQVNVANTWTGSVSTNWSVAGNWSANTVPNSSTSVTIPSAPANQPLLTSASNAVLTLTINSGASLGANGNTMTVSGLTTVNGSYNGSTNTQTFGGGLSLLGGSVSGSALVLGGDVTTGATSTFSSINGNLNLGGARNFNVALGTAGIDLFISAVVSNGSITKLGGGDLTLTSANTYSGSTSILGGTLSISTDNNLGTAPSVATPGDLVINGGALQVTLLGAPNPGNIALNSNRGIALGPTSGSGNGTIDVTDGELDYGGVMTNNGSGTGGLIKTDLGQLTLSNTSTYTGATALQNGLVVVQANGALGGAGAAGVTVSSGAELDLAGVNYTIPEALTINGNGVANTGQGVFVGNNISWAGTLTLGSNSFIRSTNNTITLSGNVNLAGQTLQINNGALTNNNRTIIVGGVVDSVGGGSIVVSAGTLQLDSSASGIPVTVNSGGTLSGKGTAGAITVKAGGTVSPGDANLAGIGTLNASAANFLSGSTLSARVTGNTGSGVTNDKLAVAGALNLIGASLSLDLTGLSKSGSLSSQNYTVGTGSPVSGTFGSSVTLLANPNGHATPSVSTTAASGTVLVSFTDVGSQWLDGPTNSASAVVPNIGQGGSQTQAKNAAPVIVAVLDTGIDAAGQTGVLPGWNFVANNSNTADDNGHGTYIASLVTSVDPSAEILPLKFLDANGQGTTAGAIAALNYAIDQGAKIVVAAWDVTDQSPAWAAEVQKAESAGVLLVMAAGNNDQSLLGPLAAVHGNNVVVVGASDGADQLASFSNADASVVDLAAPGVNVMGAKVGGGEAAHSGTSVSTALVAGTAALEWSQRPDQSYQQVVAALLNGADQEASLAAGVAGGRELNVLGALEADALLAATQVGMTPAGFHAAVTVVGMPATDLQALVGSSVDAAPHLQVQFGQPQVPAGNEAGITSIPASEMTILGDKLNSINMEDLSWLRSLDKAGDALAGTQAVSGAQDAWTDSQDWLDLESDGLAMALATR